jgi:outer membrane protein insertion porin family
MSDHSRRLTIWLILFVAFTIGTNQALAAEEEYRVSSIEIEGAAYLSSGHIKSLLETKENNLLERLKFWSKAPVFSKGLLDNDIPRIIKRYQKEGFLSVSIAEPQIDYDNEKMRVKITIVIDEGPRVKVNKVDYQLTNEDDNSRQYIEEIRQESKITTGKYFQDQAFLDDLRMIKEFYDERGYPSATADYLLSLGEHDEMVDVEIQISPGLRSQFGQIRFSGAEKTDPRLLSKHLLIVEGNRYDPQMVKRTRSRLQGLALFRLVSINLQVDPSSGTVPTEIYLQENPTYSLTFGVGYGIEDEFRVYTELTKMRFLGGLRRGSVYLKHSALEPIHVSLNLYQPAFPTIDSKLNLNPFFRLQEEPAYSLQRLGAKLSISHRVSQNTQTYIAYTYEDNDLKESSEEELEDDFERSRFYRKSSFSWGIIRDSSSPDFYPKKGTLLSNSITLSGYGFGADYRYLRWLSEARYYQNIADLFVVGIKVKAGIVKPLHEDRYIPYEDRFYAGGAFSVRGWSRASLGPKNSDGEPTGGNSLAESSLELRFPLWNQLSGVTFLDSGNVWKEPFEHDLNDLHYAAGVGLRYATPVGPLRLDIATPVFENRTSFQFFISLGQAF